jgi:hypothetical protein
MKWEPARLIRCTQRCARGWGVPKHHRCPPADPPSVRQSPSKPRDPLAFATAAILKRLGGAEGVPTASNQNESIPEPDIASRASHRRGPDPGEHPATKWSASPSTTVSPEKPCAGGWPKTTSSPGARTCGAFRRSTTHSAGALYQAFAPAEARRILRRLEFHYTPKHASWLNMVEIEIGVLRSQCLDRRIDSKEQLISEIAAWERQRNSSGARIKWMFTTDKARAKMGRAYPQPASAREAQIKES